MGVRTGLPTSQPASPGRYLKVASSFRGLLHCAGRGARRSSCPCRPSCPGATICCMVFSRPKVCASRWSRLEGASHADVSPCVSTRADLDLGRNRPDFHRLHTLLLCCILCVVFCVLYAVYSVLCMLCVLCAVYSVLCVLCVLCALCCILCAVFSALSTLRCLLCAVCSVLYSLCSVLCAVLCCTLCAVFSLLSTLRCILCALCCILCGVYSTLSTLRWTHPSRAYLYYLSFIGGGPKTHTSSKNFIATSS